MDKALDERIGDGWFTTHTGLVTIDKDRGSEGVVEPSKATPEYTGGSVSYYTVVISNPTVLPQPYVAECNDIIEALQLNYAEGNAFKAIWRRAAARLGKSKRGYTDGLYDAEKIEFFGKRLVEQEKNKESNAI